MHYIVAESLSGHRQGSNEDAIRVSHSPVPMMAISDGHGGEAHDLSEVGAQIAVAVASDAMALFYRQLSRKHPTLHPPVLETTGVALEAPSVNTEEVLPTFSTLSSTWSDEIVSKMITEWHRRIRDYSLQLGEQHVPERYGATLLAIMYVAPYVFCFQVGDGHVGFVNAQKEWVLPLLKASHLQGEETYSLCDEHAWFRSQTYVAKLKNAPRCLFACTDGIEKAYPYGEYDFLTFIRKAIETDNIKPLMQEAVKYARDDVTLGIIGLEKPFDTSDLKRRGRPSRRRPILEVASLPKHASAKEALLADFETLYHERWQLPDLGAEKRLEILLTLMFKNKQKIVSYSTYARYCALHMPSLSEEKPSIKLNHSIKETHLDGVAEMNRNDLMAKRYKAVQLTAAQEGYWYLVTPRGNLPLTAGTVIWGYDLGFMHSQALTPIGMVVKHPKEARWGIKNLSPQVWQATWQRTGVHKFVEMKGTIPLKDNLSLQLYGLPLKVYWQSKPL